MITLSHVYKFFGNHEVLKDVNLTVREGGKACHHWSFWIRQVDDSALYERS